MRNFIESELRNVLPRWREISNSPEATSALSKVERFDTTVSGRELSRREDDWREEQSLGTAADFIGAAIAVGNPALAREAAISILERGVQEHTPLGRLAAYCVRPEDAEQQEEHSAPQSDQVRGIRRRLVGYPRDPVSRMDLGRHFATIGDRKRAHREVLGAVSLSPSNRVLVRAASRFLVHEGDRDHARDILRRSGRVATDPWILAAELAIAELMERPSPYIRQARRITQEGRFAPSDISELTSALATSELKSGSERRARKLFRASLDSPTDNSLAQAEWASRQVGDVGLSAAKLVDPRGYEARAKVAFAEGDWNVALEESRLWTSDEPYSSLPAQFGSFVASAVIGDFRLGAEIARAALRVNPENATLLNNLAYAEASQDHVESAAEALRRIRNGEEDPGLEIALVATKGLVAFRSGRLEAGSESYEEAIARAREVGLHRAECFARANFVRELAVKSLKHAREQFLVFCERMEKYGLSKAREFEAIRNRLERSLTDMATATRSSQARLDLR